MNPIKETNFLFNKQSDFYRGKVRDVYMFEHKLVVVASDRISAFDFILPRAIPYKGQILNMIASQFLRATEDICPNWLESVPHPSVSIGKRCTPYPIEMVIRGYLAGHAWREYEAGRRTLCGVTLPDGLKENDKLPTPIITPATKAESGHDEDISKAQIVESGLISLKEYQILENYTFRLFQRGSEVAHQQGLILVDTKYEFGKFDDAIYLIDEIHTPDSSRYFYKEGYQERQHKGEKQKQLSKEFVRQWLISEGFQGLEGQKMPLMSDEIVQKISNRYIELYEKITGSKFEKMMYDDALQVIQRRIMENI